MHLRTADPEVREQLAELHKLITRASAMTRDLIAAGLDLKWADANLLDAGSEVAGIFDNSEPMSFR